MSKQPSVMEASAKLQTSVSDSFFLLTKKEVVERMTGLTVHSDITEKEDTGSGVITIGNIVFFVKYTPCDIELNGTQAKLKLRLTERDGGSLLQVAAALPADTSSSLTQERLEAYLDSFTSIAALYASRKDGEETAKDPEPVPKEEYKQRESAGSIERLKRDDESTLFHSSDEKPTVKTKRRHGRVIALLSILVVLAAVGTMIYFNFRGIVTSTDMSYRVTLDGAKNIEIGMTKSQVAFNLGTNGLEIEDENRVVYRSVSEREARLPTELVSVLYSGDRVESISYLNTKNANDVYKILSFPAELTPEMTVDQVVEAAGIPMSLYRRYSTVDGQLTEEVHFGYLDPTANFDPAWRGEFVVILNRADNTLNVENWGSYDGADPTMTGSIEGTSFANQYDSYTDFLNDRFQYNRSLLLLNGYSLGDTKYFFGSEPMHYSNDFGYQFYSVDSAEKLPGAEDTPLYRISIGYDNKGGFRMASFSNMRLYNKSGTLKDSDYKLVTRGMSYNEVRERMKLVPTAIYIDSSYFSVCYGRFLNTDVADEQFEVIVRFDIENSYAQKVLINTAVSNVVNGDVPQPDPAAADPNQGAENTEG